MSSNDLHGFIERIANLLRNETRQAGAAYGLQPVQLEALAYLNKCNRYSDTPQAVTDYLGLTKGTVSQTLKILAANGFITKKADLKDKRVVHLQVTKAGKTIVEKLIPNPLFMETQDQLGKTAEAQLEKNLKTFLSTMQQSNKMKSFGVCHSCRYHQETSGGRYFCGLTQERLLKKEIHSICREHEYKT